MITDSQDGKSFFVQKALPLVAMGYKVFPCQPNGKAPLTKNGCKDATTGERQISQWGKQFPNANVAIHCAECLVVDLDVKDGKDGVADLANISRELGDYPQVPVISTPTGGQHLFFKKPPVEIKNAAGVKWKGQPTGIDIRTTGGYVVACGSVIDGKTYTEIVPMVPVDQLPEIPSVWLQGDFLPLRNNPTPPPAVERPTTGATYSQKVVPRAEKYLNAMPPSISGQGGHNALLSAVNALLWGFVLDPEDARPLLYRFNERCQPPWSKKEIEHKIQSSLANPPDKEPGYLLNNTQSGSSDQRQSKKMPETPEQNVSGETSKNSESIASTPHSLAVASWYNSLMDGTPPIRYPVGDDGDKINALSFEPEAITIIGAPPGSGKSALADQLVFEALYRNENIVALIANVEQSQRVLLNRELSRISDLPYDLIRYKKLHEIHRLDRLDAGIGTITKVGDRLHWMQYPMTIERIVEETRRIDASIVLVDYIQKIQLQNTASSDHERIMYVMSKLIELKNEGRSILAISALARQTTKNGAYTNSDIGSFRGSSDLEFSATNAFLLKETDGSSGHNRHLHCLKMKEDERIHLKMIFRGSRMSFEVVGAVGGEDTEQPTSWEDATPINHKNYQSEFAVFDGRQAATGEDDEAEFAE